MKQTEIAVSGFGGQGVLFAGQVLAYAAMDSGRQVTWFPSYGPEMRGGTANCTIIIAEEEIGSPLVRNPQAVIALNLPSLDKYEPMVREGGVLLANKSLINRDFERKDITGILLPANEMAQELGNKRLVNMVMVGALIELTGALPMDTVKQALADHLPERHQKLLPNNYEALESGAAFARDTLKEKV